jgi:hypothetical protein
MAGDVLKQLLLRIQVSELYALELDESTDVASLAQLLVQYMTVTFMSGQLTRRGLGFQFGNTLPPTFSWKVAHGTQKYSYKYLTSTH